MGFFDFIIPDSIWSLDPVIGPLRSATKAARDQTPDWAVGPIKSITSIISAYYFSTPLNDAINDYTWPGPDTESLSPGNLGTLDSQDRAQAIKNHNKWADAVAFFGCHSIRINAVGEGSSGEGRKPTDEGLSMLSESAAPNGIKVLAAYMCGA